MKNKTNFLIILGISFCIILAIKFDVIHGLFSNSKDKRKDIPRVRTEMRRIISGIELYARDNGEWVEGNVDVGHEVDMDVLYEKLIFKEDGVSSDIYLYVFEGQNWERSGKLVDVYGETYSINLSSISRVDKGILVQGCIRSNGLDKIKNTSDDLTQQWSIVVPQKF